MYEKKTNNEPQQFASSAPTLTSTKSSLPKYINSYLRYYPTPYLCEELTFIKWKLTELPVLVTKSTYEAG